MAFTSEALLDDLRRLEIAFELYEHAPVETVAEMMQVLGGVKGIHTKNLFLRDAKKAFFLVTLPHDAHVDLKTMRHLIGARGNLSFASPEALADKLGVTRGAVSPLAAANDSAKEVSVCLEEGLFKGEHVNVHVLDNSKTASLAIADLERFLFAHGHPTTRFSLSDSVAKP